MTAPLRLELETIQACPNCGAVDSTLVGTRDDVVLGDLARAQAVPGAATLRNTFRRCDRCGLGFLSPRLDAASLQQVYEAWYAQGYDQVQAGADEEAARLDEFGRYHLRWVRDARPAPATLLDIGTGTGAFLRVAQAAGYTVTGVDWSAEAIAVARDRHGVAVRNGSLAGAVPDSERFEVVTMFDYLEHSLDPARDLDLALARLAPGGVLAIRVPNSGGLQSRLQGVRWANVISLHLSYFDRTTLTDALTGRGLTIVSVRAGNYQTLGELVARKLHWVARKLRPAAATASDGITAAPSGATARPRIFGFLGSSLLELIDHVGGWFGAGNNLFVIARKPE